MSSAYVHSMKDRANMLMNEDLINGDKGINSTNQAQSFENTINKLTIIEDQLDQAARNFLGGYSIEQAQSIADNADDLLVQLVNRVLYGKNAYNLVSALSRNQTVKDVKTIRERIKSIFGPELASQIKRDMSSSELAAILARYLSQGQTTIEVSEAGTQIKQLGTIFDVSKVDTSSWRKSGVIDLAGDSIFKTSKALVTKKGGAYRNMIRSILESSKHLTTQRMKTSIKNFCSELEKAMLEESTKDIPFLYGTDANLLKKQIQEFILKLQPALEEAFKSKEIQSRMKDRSNATGSIGEEIRETVTRVAADTTIITFNIGSDTDEAGVKKVNEILKGKNAKMISQMKSFKKSEGQSQTDIVLLNTRTGQTARAQSKNRFIARFTNNNSDKDIENFRWKVENGVNLFNFIKNLSQDDLGISLNDMDLTNIQEAIVNNLWFSAHGAAYPGGGGIEVEPIKVPDILHSFEGAMEKVLAGQVTNLLGVTISADNKNLVDIGGSNIFYLLNGRMKKTADLVHQAIEQIRDNMVKTVTNSLSRLVIVTIEKGAIPSPYDVRGKYHSFLPAKLKTQSNEFGDIMGEKILSNLKISVSLGTSLESLAKSSLMLV